MLKYWLRFRLRTYGLSRGAGTLSSETDQSHSSQRIFKQRPLANEPHSLLERETAGGSPTKKSNPRQIIGRYYTKTHEWFQVDNDEGVGTVGITQVAQRALGEVVFCRLPREGEKFEVMDTIATLEAVKTVGEVKSPVAGEVIEVNPRLAREPALISLAPLYDGWLVRLKFDRLPKYLLRSRSVIRAEVESLLANMDGLQGFLFERLGDPHEIPDEVDDDYLQELVFTGLNSQERLWLHKAAQDFGYSSGSRGSGAGRQLLVKRTRASDTSREEPQIDDENDTDVDNDASSKAIVGRGRRSARRVK